MRFPRASSAACLVAATLFPLAFMALPAGAVDLPGPRFPQYSDEAQVNAACDAGLKGARSRVAQIERRSPKARWLAGYDDLNAYNEDAAGPFYLLVHVHPEKAVRDAAQACTLRWQDFFSTLAQNEKLYRASQKVRAGDAVDRLFLRDIREGFEDAGIGLPKAQRDRAKQIVDRITDLGQQFDRNIREDGTRVAFSADDLKGVPESVWKDARRDDAGNYLLGLDYPTYLPVLQRAESAAARERIWRAKTNEGGDANLKLLDEIAKLRLEYAKLFGFKSYADFLLRRRMAGSAKKVDAFLADVKQAVTAGETRDLAELREAKARHLGQPADATKLDRWDVPFYTERVRKERYTVDQEAFRPYFPPQESLQFVLKLAEKLLGVTYTRVQPPQPLWHPEVQAYAATDTKTGKPIATLYVDLYPRDNKYNHAAVWSFRNGATRVHRVPQAALVVNFDRKGLTLEELETLLHELGHALHNNLSFTRYSAQGGTSVLRDFVEAPSQMLEDWVYDKRVLKLFAEVCPSCKPVPDDMIDKAVAARDYGKGNFYARQHLYGSFDIALHGPDAPEPMGLWARMEGATPLGHVPGTRFPAGFSHVAGGYAAGYYGYLWSLVIAMDLRTAFSADKLDAEIGKRYRDTVLANGGQRTPDDLLRDFLGRETNSRAFYEFLRR